MRVMPVLLAAAGLVSLACAPSATPAPAGPPPRPAALVVPDLSDPDLKRLATELASEDKDTREHAIWAAIDLGPKAAPIVPALANLLLKRKGFERKIAADALVAVGPAAADAVGALLWTLDQEPTRSTYRALEAIGPAAADAVPRLVRDIQADQLPMFHDERALAALIAIGPAARSCLDELRAAPRHTERPVRVQVHAAIAALTEDEGEARARISALVAEVRGTDQPFLLASRLSLIGRRALPEMRRILEDESAGDLRLAVCEGVDWLKVSGEELRPTLTKLAASTDRELASAAKTALARLK